MTDWNQFNPIPRGAFPCDNRRFRSRDCSFVPTGPLYAVGDVSRFSVRQNPAKRQDVVPLAARLFVGLSVGHEAAHTIDDVVRITKRVRTAQGASPDSSFLLQRGLYTSRDQSVVEEDSVQIIILDFGTPQQQFEDQMVELGETLARELDQEVIYVELQKSGIPYSVLEVTP